MKKKLVLQFEELEVESFATLGTSKERGTVFAHETDAYPCQTFFDCSTPSYCVCEPESTIQCGGTDPTWYYSCNQTLGVCPTRTCQMC